VTRISRPTRTLPEQPDIDQLRRQAKELLEGFLSGNAEASAEIEAHYWGATPRTFALHDAQLVIARAYGFDSWPKLKAHVDGVTAKRFIAAARMNDLQQVAVMLKARADLIDMQESYGDERRALHYAVMNDSREMVRLLMRHGANARVGVHPHRNATTARTIAVERELREITAIIDEEERARRDSAATIGPGRPHDSRGTSPGPLHGEFESTVRSAVAHGDTNWLRSRHAERPIVNMPDWNAGGLLTLAATNNQAEVLALLLDFGLDPDERVRWNEGPDAAYSQGYPLWHCAAAGKSEMAELLLQRGAGPNVHVDSSGSPVYAAYSHRQWAMVDLLKRYGGIVTPDIIGLYRETDLAKALLADAPAVSHPEGIPADRSVEDYLLEFALSGGAADIVRMALERMGWPRDDSRWFRMLGRGLDFWNHIPWLRSGNSDLDRGSYITGFRLLVDRCDPNVIGGFGRTALHEVAAAGDHVTAVEASQLATILLDARARTDVRDELLKSTPLGWACRWGRPEVVTVLLERGVSPFEPDAAAWATPRAWAEKMSHENVLAVLREYGA
jgi:ankyrin repeat protein